MAVLSVDLAYRRFSDIGIALLDSLPGGPIHCEFIRVCEDRVTPEIVAVTVDSLCLQRGIRIMLLDGPQGWKSPTSDLTNSRKCERILNTPAKTGLCGTVKPSNYGPFVSFSIAVYDRLTELGWERFSKTESVGGLARVLFESFPLSAWEPCEFPHCRPKRSRNRRT